MHRTIFDTPVVNTVLRGLSMAFLKSLTIFNIGSTSLDSIKKIFLTRKAKFSRLDSKMFNCFDNLAELNLNQNDLETIEEDAFASLKNLELLSLSENNI